jgi:hypothetical protein
LAVGRQAFRLIVRCLAAQTGEYPELKEMDPQSLVLAASGCLLSMAVPTDSNLPYELPPTSVEKISQVLDLNDHADANPQATMLESPIPTTETTQP